MKLGLWRLGTICSGLALFTVILLHQIERHPASVLAHADADQPVPLRTFERNLPLETAPFTGGVSVGDINGVGWLDLVLANGRHTPLYSRILLNAGRGHFLGTNLGEAPARSFCAV